jgi:hypothetical protein
MPKKNHEDPISRLADIAANHIHDPDHPTNRIFIDSGRAQATDGKIAVSIPSGNVPPGYYVRAGASWVPDKASGFPRFSDVRESSFLAYSIPAAALALADATGLKLEPNGVGSLALAGRTKHLYAYPKDAFTVRFDVKVEDPRAVEASLDVRLLRRVAVALQFATDLKSTTRIPVYLSERGATPEAMRGRDFRVFYRAPIEIRSLDGEGFGLIMPINPFA